jgi:hypothetical protein
MSFWRPEMTPEKRESIARSIRLAKSLYQTRDQVAHIRDIYKRMSNSDRVKVRNAINSVFLEEV